MVDTRTFSLDTKGGGDMIDVTGRVGEFLAQTGLRHGSVTVFVPGATGGVTTIEYESGLVHDFSALMEELAPSRRDWAHNERWGDGNGNSHIRASLVGPSLTVPVKDCTLMLGTWQQIVVIDFDARPRKRQIVFQAMGE